MFVDASVWSPPFSFACSKLFLRLYRSSEDQPRAVKHMKALETKLDGVYDVLAQLNVKGKLIGWPSAARTEKLLD